MIITNWIGRKHKLISKEDTNVRFEIYFDGNLTNMSNRNIWACINKIRVDMLSSFKNDKEYFRFTLLDLFTDREVDEDVGINFYKVLSMCDEVIERLETLIIDYSIKKDLINNMRVTKDNYDFILNKQKELVVDSSININNILKEYRF